MENPCEVETKRFRLRWRRKMGLWRERIHNVGEMMPAKDKAVTKNRKSLFGEMGSIGFIATFVAVLLTHGGPGLIAPCVVTVVICLLGWSLNLFGVAIDPGLKVGALGFMAGSAVPVSMIAIAAIPNEPRDAGAAAAAFAFVAIVGALGAWDVNASDAQP